MNLSGSKAWAILVASFFMGVAVASIAWGFAYKKSQIKWAVVTAGNWRNEARLGTYILTYLETHDSTNARRLTFAATNQIAAFKPGLKELDHYTLPLFSISERYYGRDVVFFEEFLAERNKRLAAARGKTNNDVR